jgi:hypothetical protein
MKRRPMLLAAIAALGLGVGACENTGPGANAKANMTLLLAATRTALLSASGFLIHRGPPARLRFFLGHAAILVTLFDVFSLSFCLSVYFPLSPLDIIRLSSLCSLLLQTNAANRAPKSGDATAP